MDVDLDTAEQSSSRSIEQSDEDDDNEPEPNDCPYQEHEVFTDARGRLINLEAEGKKHWKLDYRKLYPAQYKKLLKQKQTRNALLNRMWNLLDVHEKQRWIVFAKNQLRNKNNRGHVVITKVTEPKFSDDVAVDDGSSPMFFIDVNPTTWDEQNTAPNPSSSHDRSSKTDEPLRNLNGKVINLVARGRRYWKADYRKSNSELFHVPKKARTRKLNEIWMALDKLEQQKWINIAETRMRDLYGYPKKVVGIEADQIPGNSNNWPQMLRNRRRQGTDIPRKRARNSVLKDIPKPQEKFEFKIDNSDRPFVPVLNWKPNGLYQSDSQPIPYVPKRKVEQDGTESPSYIHPYEAEILAWKPDESLLAEVTDFVIPEPLTRGCELDLISTVDGVNDMLNELKKVTEIGVDVEHHSVRSFMGLTCLIQISTRTKDFIVDGLAMYRNLEILNQVFTNPKIVKVFHGAQSDIQWLQRDYGIYVVGMFDTCIAGEQIFGSSLSLKYLLETYVDEVEEVDKYYQIADWRVRPLPPDMIHYARMDTHFLLRLYDILKNMMLSKEVERVFLDSSARCLTVYEKPESKPSTSLIEIAKSLNTRQKYTFRELFKWRNILARQEDESAEQYILSNEDMERLARTLPNNAQYLTEILDSNYNNIISPLVVREMETILKIISIARQLPLAQGEQDDLDDESERDQLPGSDIRNISVVPSVMELFAMEDNLVEKNIIIGPYQSASQYLKIQFQLLREDFIRSVKPGLKDIKTGLRLKSGKGIKVHSNIKFLGFGARKMDSKHKWKIQLPDQLRNMVIGRDTKRFIPGCLLLFTNNNFTDTYCGIIDNPRDNKATDEEKYGIFTVNIKGELPSIPWNEDEPILTVECDAYFEPYKSVMTALKQNTWLKQLPISKYLLNGAFTGTVPQPNYVKEARSLQVSATSITSTNKDEWPTPHELGFDEAQFSAYHAALTQEFVLIQGPPGTGKTYVGLRILKTLMEKENRHLWRKNGGGPILVTCYTNHALDQFGDGILETFTSEDQKNSDIPYKVTNPRIVRLGTGCQSSRLKDYTLGNGEKLKHVGVDIILLTTTGAAMRIASLKKLNIRIMIIEEAAEMFESHVVGCLTRSLQHLILLGDHQQLRPITSTMDLSSTYHLNVSLFERLVANNFPRFMLQVQHRMKPEIRDLITGPHIYPILKDGPNVSLYPPVRGLQSSLFFIDHQYPESEIREDETSKSNPFEASFLGALCQYLISRAHPPQTITVLAMYMAQVKLLEMEIWYNRRIPRALRIETVDSFQGEENNIVLLSLVRSNHRGEIGFMREDNRINVALSRAKHGLYIIGNMRLLASASPTWRVINEKLRRNGFIGHGLGFICDNHQPVQRAWARTSQEIQNLLSNPCPMCINHRARLINPYR